MTVRRPRLTLLGAVLGLMAVFGLSVLSGWHGALVDDHVPAHAASIAHSHETSGQKDPDGPIHLMAHATGQWLAPAGQPLVPVVVLAAKTAWATGPAVVRESFDPSRLMRPPRG